MLARWALRKIFERIAGDQRETILRVEFSDGSVYQSDPGKERSDILVRFRTPGSEWHSLLFFYEGLFECFIDGTVDLEGEQPIAALARFGHNTGIVPGQLLADMLRKPAECDPAADAGMATRQQ
jgi:hypothetical protein